MVLTTIIAGTLYSARWIWEMTEGILKNKQYPPSFVSQNFFSVKLLMIITLLFIYRGAAPTKSTKAGLLLASLGLAWTAITRTVEAYGASGPWGFYSSPGLLLFIAGSWMAGSAMARCQGLNRPGNVLRMISLFNLLGSFSSMLLFNYLGRDEGANATGSLVANIFLTGEGICWVALGTSLLTLRRDEQSAAFFQKKEQVYI